MWAEFVMFGVNRDLFLDFQMEEFKFFDNIWFCEQNIVQYCNTLLMLAQL